MANTESTALADGLDVGRARKGKSEGSPRASIRVPMSMAMPFPELGTLEEPSGWSRE